MNSKKAIYILIFILSLSSVFILGRLGYVYQMNLMKPDIEIISEINPNICLINIKDFNSTYISGNVNLASSRFVYKDKIFLPDEQGNFQIAK